MQDKYVGDVGDFGKYGLLRALCGLHDDKRRLRLAVIWCVPRVLEKGHNEVDYLGPGHRHAASLAKCDPLLYAELKCLDCREQRTLKAVERSQILPAGTGFSEKPADFPTGRRSGSGPQIVFLDPDNGIRGKAMRRDLAHDDKYVFLDELKKFYSAGHSLVVYHHLGRHNSAEEQVNEWEENLRATLNPVAVWPLVYHRGTCRVFFVAPANAIDARLLRTRRDAFLQNWQPHFEMF
jgi:hypothetical protein